MLKTKSFFANQRGARFKVPGKSCDYWRCQTSFRIILGKKTYLQEEILSFLFSFLARYPFANQYLNIFDVIQDLRKANTTMHCKFSICVKFLHITIHFLMFLIFAPNMHLIPNQERIAYRWTVRTAESMSAKCPGAEPRSMFHSGLDKTSKRHQNVKPFSPGL